jgi:hypothetical protein
LTSSFVPGFVVPIPTFTPENERFESRVFKSLILFTSAFHPLAVNPLPEPTVLIVAFQDEYPIERIITVPKNTNPEYTDFFQKERFFIK